MRYRFDDFVLDLETVELRRSDEVVPLRRQTFKLLQFLVESAPALQRRDDILDRVWGHDALSPNALPQAISELRRALGDQADAPRFIETRRGSGYRFVAEIHAQPPVGETPVVPPVAPSANDQLRKLGLAALLLSAVAVIGAAALWMMPLWQSVPSVSQTRSAAVSLALAPLPADADTPEWVPYAALELFSHYLQGDQLRIYRGEALGLGTSADPLRWQHQARDLLGASHTLTGRWQRLPSAELVLRFSLLELRTGQVLLSQSVRGQATDLEKLIERASAQLSEALSVAQPAPEVRPQSLQPADREEYLTALAALARGDANSAVAPLRRLHQQLAEPAWLEVDLARALAGSNQRQAAIDLLDRRLATAKALPVGERLRLQAQLAGLRYQPVAAAAALRALVEIYPDDIDSWIALVEQELDALQGNSARATMARLDELSPERPDPRVRLLRSRLARIEGDYERASAEATGVMEQAESFDLPPLALDAALSQAQTLRAKGQIDSAQTLLADADERWAKRVDDARLTELRLERMRLLRIKGELKAARAVLAAMPETVDPVTRGYIAVERALLESYSGQHATADAILAEIDPVIAQVQNPPLQIAALDALGYVALARNDVPRAQQAYAEAFQLAKQTGLERQSVALMINAGRLFARQRRLLEADGLWEQALTVFIKLGDRRGQATALGNLAASASLQGHSERANELNLRALELFRELALAGPRARTAYNLALSALRDGRLAQANDLFAEAAQVWLHEERIELAIKAVIGQVDIALLMADPSTAERHLDALAIERVLSPLARSHLHTARAQTTLYQGHLEAARQAHLLALELRQEAGATDWAALSELALARLDLLTGGDPVEVRVRAEILQFTFTENGETRDAGRAALLVAEAALASAQADVAKNALVQVQAALDSFYDERVAMDLNWLRIWTVPDAERRTRLMAFRQRALSSGYKRHALQAAAALGEQDALAASTSFQLPNLPYAP